MTEDEKDKWKVKCGKETDAYEKESRRFERFSNTIYIDLTKQLITLNTVLITVSFVFVNKLGNNKFISSDFLTIIWVLIVISILAGIVQLLVEYNYYDKFAKSLYMLALRYNQCETKEEYLYAKKLQDTESKDNFKESSSQIPFYIQIISFMIVILIVLGGLIHLVK